MADQLGSALSGVMGQAQNLGGEALKGIGDIGGAIGKEAMALPGQIGDLFGGGKQAPTGITAGGDPTVNLGAASPNGTPGAIGASAASAMPGAATAASADPASLNAPPPIDAALAGLANNGAGPAGSVTPPSMDALQQGLAAASADPMAARIASGSPAASSGDPMADRLGPPGAFSAQGAPPNAIKSLIHTLTQPEMLKMELPGALYGLNAINAMQPSGVEKTMKAQLANAEGQQSLTQRQLAAEQSGQLPQQIQQAVDLKAKQAEAAIRQRYAQAGMSGSAAEAADIANAQAEAQVQAFQEAQAMVGQTAQILGGYDTEVSQYLSNLFTTESARDAALRQSITGFLSAAGYAAPGAAGKGS